LVPAGLGDPGMFMTAPQWGHRPCFPSLPSGVFSSFPHDPQLNSGMSCRYEFRVGQSTKVIKVLSGGKLSFNDFGEQNRTLSISPKNISLHRSSLFFIQIRQPTEIRFDRFKCSVCFRSRCSSQNETSSHENQAWFIED
jgi:hypothetical protein